MSPKLSKEDKEQRKTQIIAAAMEVFKRKGFEKATLKDIVEEADMSRGWIYLYFPDKIEIFQAMLDQLDAKLAGELADLNMRHHSVIAALKEYFENNKENIASARDSLYPAIYEFFITGWREPKIQDYFSKRYERTVALFTKLLQSGIDSGELKAGAPIEMVAKSIMSGIDGILIHFMAFGSNQVQAEMQMDELANRVLHRLLTASHGYSIRIGVQHDHAD